MFRTVIEFGAKHILLYIVSGLKLSIDGPSTLTRLGTVLLHVNNHRET